MLNRNNHVSQSCSMLSETVKSVYKCSDQGSLIKVNNTPTHTFMDNQINLQKVQEKSFFKQQISIEPKKIHIFYGNQATQYVPTQNNNKMAEIKMMDALPMKKS